MCGDAATSNEVAIEAWNGVLFDRFVRANARKSRQSPRTTRPGLELRDHGTELRLGSRRVAGLVVPVGGVDGAAECIVACVGRCQLARAVEQQPGGARSAPSARMLRGPL